MNAQIEILLSMWGRWALRRESGAIGYPRVSPMFNDLPSGDGYGSGAPLDIAESDLQAIDKSVNGLPLILRVTVIGVYQHGMGKSLREIAGGLGINRMTLGKYISSAHEWIAIDMRNQFSQNQSQFDSVSKCVRKPASL